MRRYAAGVKSRPHLSHLRVGVRLEPTNTASFCARGQCELLHRTPQIDNCIARKEKYVRQREILKSVQEIVRAG